MKTLDEFKKFRQAMRCASSARPWVHRHNLAGNEPIEQHAHRCELPFVLRPAANVPSSDLVQIRRTPDRSRVILDARNTHYAKRLFLAADDDPKVFDLIRKHEDLVQLADDVINAWSQ